MSSVPNPGVGQRLLYLHARIPNGFSEMLGYAPVEPVRYYKAETRADFLD
ncbi:MAG: hypothetical protein OXH56_14315 [Gemmatimonadetes bacterium]|nr:hypothetical protein [Gemmatimonadota bacterium]